MKSLLFSDDSPFTVPPGCGLGRREVVRVVRKNGRLYKMFIRDKIMPEDPYLVMVKAGAFAIGQGEPYPGTPPERSMRDFLVKQNVVI
jgi:hypothetical protein